MVVWEDIGASTCKHRASALRIERPALRGLPWWLARGDTVSIARFGRRAAEVARSDTQPVAVLRGRYYTAAAAAYLALLRGDSAGAERRLLAISDTLCLVGYCFGEKVALAQLLAARGKDQEAAAILDRWSTVAAAPRPMVVLDAWPRPDPVLQVFVDEARAGLVRMDARAVADRAPSPRGYASAPAGSASRSSASCPLIISMPSSRIR